MSTQSSQNKEVADFFVQKNLEIIAKNVSKNRTQVICTLLISFFLYSSVLFNQNMLSYGDYGDYEDFISHGA